MPRTIFDTVVGTTVPTTSAPSLLDTISTGREEFISDDPQALGRYGLGESKHDWGIRAKDIDRLDEIRASHQSGFEQFGAFLNQGVVGEIVGGTLEGAGYLGDIEGMVNMARGEEQEFGNWLSDIGKSIRTWSEEATPIYRDPRAAEFDPTDWSWWMSNGKSVFSTLALVIPSGLAVKGMTKAAQALGALNKISPVAKWAAQGVSQAVVSRHMESLMEASGLHQEVYDDAIRKGMSEEDALKKASIAASSVYNKNWAMLAQDIPQYLLFNKAFGKGAGELGSQSLRTSAKMGYSLAPIVGKKAAAIGWDMATEGAEEGYQYIVQEESRRLADKIYGEDDGSTFPERLRKYVNDGDFKTSVWFGALGSGMFQTVGKKANQWIKGEKDLQLEDVKGWAAQIDHAAQQVRNAKILGASSGIEAAKDAFKTVMMSKSASVQGLQNLKEFVKTLSNPSQEDLERFNVSKEELELLQIDSKDFLNDIENFEKKWDANARKYQHVTDRMTRAEFLLEKYNARRLDMLDKKDQYKSEIVNMHKMSDTGRTIFELESRVKAKERVIAFQNERLSKQNLDGADKEQAESTIATLQKAIEADKEYIRQVEEEYTPEEKKTDKELNLDSARLYEFQDILNSIEYAEQSIDELQNAMTKLKKEEKDKNTGKFEEKSTDSTKSTEPDVDQEDTEDDFNEDDTDYTIEIGDLVQYSSEGQTIEAVVNYVDDAGDYVISPVDSNRKQQGDSITTSAANLTLNEKYLTRDKYDVEPVSDEDFIDTTTKEEFDRGINKLNSGTTDPARSLAYIAFEDDVFNVLQKELNDYITSASNPLTEAKAHYSIDVSSEDAVARWSKLGIPAGIKSKILNNTPLTEEEIDQVLEANPSLGFNNVIDRIPIKVTLEDGDKTFKGKMYVHDSDWKYIYVPQDVRDQGETAVKEYKKTKKLDIRKTRQTILTALLSGNKAYSKNISKSVGHYNNVKKRTNIITTLGGKLAERFLVIVRNNKQGYKAIDSIVPTVEGTPGSIVVTTDKTCTGETAHVKVVPMKLTKEHADILYDAIETMFTSGEKGKGGAKAAFPDDRVTGLNVSEVIKYLALFGDKSTNVNNPKNKLGKHLLSKQLFVHDGKTLYYGENGKLNLWETGKRKEVAKKQFIEWATKNKNYNVMLNHKDLGIQLNSKLKKSFKIGSWSYDKSEDLTYAQMLISKPVDGKETWAVMTDLEEWKDTGSVMTRPVLILGKSIEDIVIEEVNKSTPSKATVSNQTKAAADKNGKVFRNAADVVDLPAGSMLYKIFDIPDEYGNKIGDQKIAIFKIVMDDKGHRILSTNGLNKRNFVGIDNVDLDAKIDRQELISKKIEPLFIKYNNIYRNDEPLRIDTGSEPIVETPAKTAAKAPKKPVETRSPEKGPDTSTKTTMAEKGSIEAQKADIERSRQGELLKLKRNKESNNPEYVVISEARWIAEEKRINAKYDTELVALKQPAKLISDITEQPNTGHTIDDLKDILGTLEAFEKENYIKIDVDKELKWFRKRFGNLPVEIVDKLISLGGDKVAFGRLLSDMILIYNNAVEGTLYHEAMHRVTLGLLDSADRKKLYDAAKKYYNMPNATEKQIDEALADGFMSYKVSGAKPKNRTILQFFSDLWDTIKSMVTGKTKMTSFEIETFFEDVDRGKFRYVKPSKENIALMAKLKPALQIPIFDNTTDFNRFIIKLDTLLLQVNQIDDLNKISNIRFTPLYQKIDSVDPNNYGIIQKLASAIANTKKLIEEGKIAKEQIAETNLKIDQTTNIYNLYKAVVSDEYKQAFEEAISDGLIKFNIKRKKADDYDNSKDQRLDSGKEDYDAASYEVNSKDNILASIKFLIATLPASEKIDPYTGTPEYVDFNVIWSTLKYDLRDADTIEEMIDILENKEDKYPYKVLLDKIRNDKTGYLKQQFRVAMSGHKHKFINFLFKKVFNRKEGTVKYNFEITDADTQRLSKQLLLKWNLYFYQSDFVNHGKDTVTTNDEEIKSLITEYDNFVKEINKEYKKAQLFEDLDKTISKLVGLLNGAMITVDNDTIYEYISTFDGKDPHEALHFVINDRIKHIFNNLKDLTTLAKPELTSIYNNESVVRELTKAYARIHPELINDVVLGPENNMNYTYSKNSYVTDRLRKFRKDRQSVVDLSEAIGHKYSYYLGQMLEDDGIREGLDLYTFSSFTEKESGHKGSDYLRINSLEDYLFKMIAFDKGLIPFPTMADKKTYYLLRGPQVFSRTNDIYNTDGSWTINDKVIDIVYGYLQEERERINAAKAFRKKYKDAKIAYDAAVASKVEEDIKTTRTALTVIEDQAIENYHYIMDGDKKIFEGGNAYVFHYFPSFNEKAKKKDFDFDTQARDLIRPILEANIDAEIQHAIDIGIIGISAAGKLYNIAIDDEILNKEFTDTQSRDQAIRNVISRMFINSTVSNIEVDKLFTGDPAFYKKSKNTGDVHEDRMKRFSVLSSTGDTFSEISDIEGMPLTTYGVSTLNTQKYATVYQEMFQWHIDAQKQVLQKFYEKKGVTKSEETISAEAKVIVQEKLAGYNKMDTTDGQAWISPSMYRMLSIKLGEWSDSKQRAFELLQSGKKLSLAEEQEALAVTFQPLKLVYFDLILENSLAIPTYDKMSVATVFRQMAKDNQIEDMLDRMESTGKYSDPNLTKVDMFKMDSATKVGIRNKSNYYDSSLMNVNDLSGISVFEQKYTSLRRQLITDPHDVERTKTGTQFLKLVLSNLDLANAIYNLPGNSQPVTGQEISRIAFDSLKALSDKGRADIERQFGIENGRLDMEKFVAAVKRNAIASDSSRNLIDAIKLDDDGKKMYLEADSFSDKNWMQSMIISMIDKQVIDIKLPGNQFVQFSNFGLRKVTKVNSVEEQVENAEKGVDFVTWIKEKTTDLKYYRKDANGTTKSMQCIVSINLFKHIIPRYDMLTFEQKVEYLKENPEIMGYRIPTQGQNSISSLEVVGVYPETIGDTITLPSEFTTLTGSDFDIDKLYVARYNYTINRKKLVKIPFIDGDTNDDKVLTKLYRNRYGKILNLWAYLNRKAEIAALAQNDLYSVSDKLTEEQIDVIHRMYDSIEDEQAEIDLMSVMTEGKFTTAKYLSIGEYVNSLPTAEEFIAENKGKSIYSLNSKKAVENKLLDVYFSILKNPNHYSDVTSPLGFVNNRMKELAARNRKYNEKNNIKLDLQIASPRYQQLVKWYYTSGKNGIGPFALNNVHHILGQLAGLGMRFSSNGVLHETQDGFVDLSQIYDKNEAIQIQSWLSGLIDAFVDVVKDTYIIDLNVNEYTYNVVALLLRGGLGEMTFDFTSQPILKELADAQVLGNKSKNRITKQYTYTTPDGDTFNVSPTTYIKNKWKAMLKGDVDYVPSTDMSEVMTDKLVLDIKNQDITNQAFIRRQLNVLATFEELKGKGATLNTLIQGSQVDTKKYGNSLVALQLFMENIRRAYLSKEFINLDKVLPFDPIAMEAIENIDANFLGTYIENSILFAFEIFNDISIYATPVFQELYDQIYRVVNPPLLSKDETERTAKGIADELFASIASGFYTNEVGMTPAKLTTLFNKIVNTIGKIQRNEDGKYDYLQSNELIMRYLNLVPADNAELPFNFFISVPARSLKNSEDRDNLTDYYRDLMKSKDKEVRDLARLLQVYSFYTSGFRNRIFSFFNIVPNELQKAMTILDPVNKGEEKVVSYNDHIRQNRLRMADMNLLPAYSEHVDEVFINNWESDMIVPELSFSLVTDRFDVVGNSRYPNDAVLVLSKARELFVGTDSTGKPLFKPYVKVSDENTLLYKFVGAFKIGSGEETVYNPIYKLVAKKSYSNRGQIIKEYGMPKSIVPSNNTPNPSIKDVMAMLSSNKFATENPTLANPIFYDFSSSLVKEYRDQILEDDMESLLVEKPKTEVTEVPVLEVETEGEEVAEPYTATTEIEETTEDMKPLSTKEKPLQIYTDGSDIKGTGQIGSGVWFEHAGKEYSRSNIYDVDAFRKQYNITESVSNPTMEIIALVNALDEFKNTSEHLVIYSDYEGVQKWVSGEWKAKKPYIKDLVDLAKSHILSIENNGGSVKLVHVPGHSGIKGNEKVDAVAKSRNEYNNITPLVDRSITNKKTVSKDPKQLSLFSLEITGEQLDQLNKKHKTTYTMEEFNALPEDERSNIIRCL